MICCYESGAVLTLLSTPQKVTNDLLFMHKLTKDIKQIFEYVLEDNNTKETYHDIYCKEKLAKLQMKTLLCNQQGTFAQTPQM